VAPLDPRPQRVLRFALGYCLALPRGLDRLVGGVQRARELAGSRARRGTRPSGGIHATGGPVATDADDRIARHIAARPPVDAGLPLRTVRLLGVLIYHKGLQGIALAVLPLPAVGRPQAGPHDVELRVRLGGDQEVRLHTAAVE